MKLNHKRTNIIGGSNRKLFFVAVFFQILDDDSPPVLLLDEGGDDAGVAAADDDGVDDDDSALPLFTMIALLSRRCLVVIRSMLMKDCFTMDKRPSSHCHRRFFRCNKTCS